MGALGRFDPTIFSLLSVAFFVGANVVPNLLVLLEEEPEHSVEFLVRLNLHFRVTAHLPQLFLQILHALDVVALKLTLVRHDVVVGKDKVLVELVVEGLAGDLDADA